MTEAVHSTFPDVDEYIPDGAQVVDVVEADGLLVHVLHSDRYNPGEQVLLEVTEPKGVACLWEPGEKGSSLKIETKTGNGQLVTFDVGTGEEQRKLLTTGVDAEIKPGTIYWYENSGGPSDPLLVLDTCVGFNEAHEPTIAKVREQLQKIDFTSI